MSLNIEPTRTVARPEHKPRASGKNIPGVYQEERCGCGQLLAILLAGGIEIKCRRCKRLWTLSFEELKKFISAKEHGGGAAGDVQR